MSARLRHHGTAAPEAVVDVEATSPADGEAAELVQ
jgi:hypothetical protein